MYEEHRAHRLSYNATFVKVMSEHPDLCKGLLERILEIEIEDLREVSVEKVAPQIINRSVICDVLVKGANAYYEVEMQAYEVKDLAQRTEFYRNRVGSLMLAKGAKFNQLLPLHLVYICTFDPFDDGEAVYVYKSTRQQGKPHIMEGRGSETYVNATASRDSLSPEMIALFDYIQNDIVTQGDSLIQSLEKAINDAFSNEDWRSGVLTLEERMEDYGDYRFEKGKEELLNELVADGLIAPEQAAKYLSNKPVQVDDNLSSK